VPRISGLWRMDAFFEGPPSVDHNTRVLVTTWVMGLLGDSTPPDAVAIADRRFGTIYRAIVAGTDVEVTYRLIATGSPRLLELRRIG
jgi:hypothetical protein